MIQKWLISLNQMGKRICLDLTKAFQHELFKLLQIFQYKNIIDLIIFLPIMEM